MKKARFGVAKSEAQAVSIFNQFKGAGFADKDISVLFPYQSGTRQIAHQRHTKASEGAAMGASGGLVVGGALGWLVGVGTLAIPGLGPLLAAGPIIAAFAGAGVGAAAGGAAGSVIGMEIPEFEAIQYQEKMDGGEILISVLTSDATERRRVREIFKNAGSVSAAEAVVDHAYGRPLGAFKAAMTPTSEHVSDPPLPENTGPTI